MDTLFGEADDPVAGQTRVPASAQPLAARMRPATLEELAGQGHLLEPGSALRTALEEGNPHSMVLYGPPGTGKTTIARLMAVNASAAFEELSAVNAGRAEVRAVLERAGHRRATSGEPTILFLDEIHRFNKAQQDVLLPAVEEGLVTLVGATTENPYFEVNSALLSRCRVYELHPLGDDDVAGLIRRALGDPRGLPDPPAVADDAIDFLAARAGGDARTALAALELAAETAGEAGVTLEVAEDALQRRAVLYDKGGDRHYDTISAWIKATRGSDPDASLLYLAIMLEGGEDPRFIARRMVILASEDIGNADPARPAAGGRGGPGGGARGAPGVRAQPRPGHRLPLPGAEEQRLVRGARPRPGVGARARSPRPAGAHAQRRLPRGQGTGTRRGLRLPAFPPRGRLVPGADAARGRRRAVPGAVRRTVRRRPWRSASRRSRRARGRS